MRMRWRLPHVRGFLGHLLLLRRTLLQGQLLHPPLHQQHQHQPGFAPQQPPMMMQTPAGMVPVMPVGQPGGYVQTPRGLVQMVPTMVHPRQPPRAPGQSYYQAPGQSYYQAPGQTNPPPPPQ